MPWAKGIPTFITNNSLSLAMFGLFFMTLIGLSLTGWQHHNEELQAHHEPQQSYSTFILSGEFAEAVFENWESEFLQMWVLVVLTIYLKQKGSADSKKLKGREPEDTSSRYSVIRARAWKTRGRALVSLLYSNSLGLALFGLFLFSFVMHAWGGMYAYNSEATQHGQEQITIFGYAASSQFWFESFQNWQSEFLAVGSLLILSIFLRQRGSPESKPIGTPHNKTGD